MCVHNSDTRTWLFFETDIPFAFSWNNGDKDNDDGSDARGRRFCSVAVSSWPDHIDRNPLDRVSENRRGCVSYTPLMGMIIEELLQSNPKTSSTLPETRRRPSRATREDCDIANRQRPTSLRAGVGHSRRGSSVGRRMVEKLLHYWIFIRQRPADRTLNVAHAEISFHSIKALVLWRLSQSTPWQ